MVQINDIFFNGDEQPELIVVPEPSNQPLSAKRERPVAMVLPNNLFQTLKIY